jgi:protein TonB
MRLVLAAGAALVITAVIMVTAAQLVRERPPELDITAPVPVALVTVPREDTPPEEPEPTPPEPPEEKPQVDFAPELPAPSLTAPQLSGPSVAIDPGLFGGVAPSGPMVFEVGDLDRPPQSVVRRQPDYPFRARQRRIEGRVRVRFLVGTDGKTSQITILESEPDGVFDEAVRNAVAGWRFEPGVIGGERVASWVVTPIVFDLSGGR